MIILFFNWKIFEMFWIIWNLKFWTKLVKEISIIICWFFKFIYWFQTPKFKWLFWVPWYFDQCVANCSFSYWNVLFRNEIISNNLPSHYSIIKLNEPYQRLIPALALLLQLKINKASYCFNSTRTNQSCRQFRVFSKRLAYDHF